MKDQWYGDNRDLAKWGVLLTLSRAFKLGHVLQVLYLRPSTWGKLEIDGEPVDLPDAVTRHFRNSAAIAPIDREVTIEVIEDLFQDRRQYLNAVVKRIQGREHVPGLVFLDPDTGLESGSPGPEHVLNSELAEVWKHLIAGDVLVFYQHQTNRNGTPWIETKKSQLERAIGIVPGKAKVAWSPEIARDVVFFFVQKATSLSPV